MRHDPRITALQRAVLFAVHRDEVRVERRAFPGRQTVALHFIGERDVSTHIRALRKKGYITYERRMTERGLGEIDRIEGIQVMEMLLTCIRHATLEGSGKTDPLTVTRELMRMGVLGMDGTVNVRELRYWTIDMSTEHRMTAVAFVMGVNGGTRSPRATEEATNEGDTAVHQNLHRASEG
jgi:hypothetical protein